MADFKVGQKMWRVPIGNDARRNTKPEQVTITKIGRRWASYGEGWRANRFDMKTMYEDGGDYSPNGKLYHSLEEYEEEKKKVEIWTDFMIRNRHPSPPKHLSFKELEEIFARLRGDDE